MRASKLPYGLGGWLCQWMIVALVAGSIETPASTAHDQLRRLASLEEVS